MVANASAPYLENDAVFTFDLQAMPTEVEIAEGFQWSTTALIFHSMNIQKARHRAERSKIQIVSLDLDLKESKVKQDIR